METGLERFEKLEAVVRLNGGIEMSALDVYTDIFKLGEGYLQNVNEEGGHFKSNPVGFCFNYKRDKDGNLVRATRKDGTAAYSYEKQERSARHLVMFEDTFAESLKVLQEADFAILNGLTYFGRRNRIEFANKMYALIIDLDGVTERTLGNYFYAAKSAYGHYPLPNYIALSGHGVHLYFVFEEPVPLYPDIKLCLRELKYGLIEHIWNQYTSEQEHIEVQGINQGFRVLGGKPKPGVGISSSKVFRINTHPFSLEDLNNYVAEEKRIDKKRLGRLGKVSFAEAEVMWPEWAKKVKDKKKFPGRLWDISGMMQRQGKNPYALYEWWLRKIYSGAQYHARYFSVMCLAIFAIKCAVPRERLEKDARELQPYLNSLAPDDPFTESDINSALECYDLDYCTFPRKEIETLSRIRVPASKRNGRTREVHLALMRNTKDKLKQLGELERDGRPVGSGTKEDIVNEYLDSHPDASVSSIAKELNVSRTTVYKWLKGRITVGTPFYIRKKKVVEDSTEEKDVVAKELAAKLGVDLEELKLFLDKQNKSTDK